MTFCLSSDVDVETVMLKYCTGNRDNVLNAAETLALNNPRNGKWTDGWCKTDLTSLMDGLI